METCAFCGFDNVSGTLFCEGCGSGLTPEAQGHRYSTGSVVAAHAAAGTSPRLAGSRFTTGDVSEDDADVGVLSARAPRVETPPDYVAPASRPAGGDEHAALIGTDATWGTAERAAPIAGAGSGPIAATPPTNTAPPFPAATPPSSAHTASPIGAGVYLTSESGRRVDVPAQDVVIVGREDMRSGIRPDVDLTLDGASAAGVSRRHCRLLRQADGWYVEDLMSTNFTVLNGKALPPHTPTRLHHGDELRLGKMRLRFQQG